MKITNEYIYLGQKIYRKRIVEYVNCYSCELYDRLARVCCATKYFHKNNTPDYLRDYPCAVRGNDNVFDVKAGIGVRVLP